MALPVHLVGSVPLDSAQDVFSAVSATLGDRIQRLPDGETGERSGWVGSQIPRFAQHPQLEFCTSTRPGRRAEDVDDAVRATGKDYERPRFRLTGDVESVRFGALGYAAAVRESYAIFRDQKERGVVAAHIRFQVSLPTPQAPLIMFIEPDDIPRLHAPYRAAMLEELDEILRQVPHDQLAIQWDVAPEIAQLEGAWPVHHDDPAREITDELLDLGRAVPGDVPVGFHLCYGDFGGKHFTDPRDLGLLTGLANKLADGLDHLDWVHMPVPADRDDEKYFAPLANLHLREETQFFLGLVHDSDGVPGALRRIGAAREYLSGFGIATECGFGRRSRDSIGALLRLHREVSETALAPPATTPSTTTGQ
jgi:hypothetical protein